MDVKHHVHLLTYLKVGERRERAEGGDDRETTVAMP